MNEIVLHLSHDDKFIDLMIDEFNQVSSFKNKYVVYTNEVQSSLKFIKHPDVFHAKKGSDEFNDLIGDISGYKAIFVHYLSSYLSEFVLSLPKNTPLFMIFWGAEIFTLKEFYNDNLLTETKDLINKITPKNKFKFAFNPKNLVLEIKRMKARRNDEIKRKKALKRVNYFCHWIPEDFNFIRSKISFNSKLLDFIYGPLEVVIGEHYDSQFSEGDGNVLLGNSGNETNNHLESLSALKNAGCKDRLIYTPLSYSALSRLYIDIVVRKGKELFGDSFVPLFEFIPKEEYHKILNSCDFVVMNHLRSQGGAVNRFALYQGKKLFMNNSSNMCQFYKKNGLSIFSLTDCNSNYHSAWAKLNIEEKKQNRAQLIKIFGNKAVKKKYENIALIIENL